MHGFARGHDARRRGALVGVEEQDAVFGDDADDHDEAHEAGDVEGGSGDEQGQDDAGDGEDGAGEDGDGGGEVAELREQDAEDEHEGEEEDAEEFVEGLLLLLVGAAVLDADGGGRCRPSTVALDLGDGGAEVGAFEAAGDDDELLEIFAEDLVLRRQLGDLWRASRGWRSCRWRS